MFKDLPTMSNSLWFAFGLKRLHKSMVKTVLELLKIDVSEVTIADSMAAMIKPRAPANNDLKNN